MIKIEIQDAKAKIHELLDEFNASLPKEVRISGVSKIPFKALSWRETLYYRNAELSNTAFELFNNNRYLPATILIRAQMETTGLLAWSHYKIHKCVEEKSLGDIDDFFMRGLFGGRESGRILEAHNVLTGIDKVGREFRDAYDMLSEFAHPNCFGTHTCFSKLDTDNYRILLDFYFDDLNWEPILSTFLLSLHIFRDIYNYMADDIYRFYDICESLVQK
jgi:hypothetical protein